MMICGYSFTKIAYSLLLNFWPSQVEPLGRESWEELRKTIERVYSGPEEVGFSQVKRFHSGICRCPGFGYFCQAWLLMGKKVVSSRVCFSLKGYGAWRMEDDRFKKNQIDTARVQAKSSQPSLPNFCNL